MGQFVCGWVVLEGHSAAADVRSISVQIEGAVDVRDEGGVVVVLDVGLQGVELVRERRGP